MSFGTQVHYPNYQESVLTPGLPSFFNQTGRFTNDFWQISQETGELVFMQLLALRPTVKKRSGITTGPADPASGGGAAPLGGGILKIC